MSSKLEIGDILKTKIGEVYVYLGYFKGSPRSFYKVPDEGYLYVFCGCAKEISSVVEVERNIYFRERSGFDGNFSYTKNPKRFAEKIGHLNIAKRPAVMNLVQIERSYK